jgi:hypothetical protein
VTLKGPVSSHVETHNNNSQIIKFEILFDIHNMPAAYVDFGNTRFVTPAHCTAQATQAGQPAKDGPVDKQQTENRLRFINTQFAARTKLLQQQQGCLAAVALGQTRKRSSKSRLSRCYSWYCS